MTITSNTLDTGGAEQPAHIGKTVVERDGRFCVVGESGRNFGCYDTKEEADARLDQMRSFSEKRATSGAEYEFSVITPIAKADEKKRLVYGVVLEPEEVDAQDDIIDEEGIERSAHAFLRKFNRGSELGLNHLVLGAIGVDLAESYIAPVDFTLGTEQVKKGSWVMVVHVVQDSVWARVQRGELTGFSVAGLARIAQG